MKQIVEVVDSSPNVTLLKNFPRIGSRQILAVHSESYFQKILEKSKNLDSISHKTPLSGICGDTFIGKHSVNAAYFAASGKVSCFLSYFFLLTMDTAVCTAVDRVVRRECRNAFCVVSNTTLVLEYNRQNGFVRFGLLVIMLGLMALKQRHVSSNAGKAFAF